MHTYLIPRKIGDENRYLFFTTKSLIGLLLGGLTGSIFLIIFMLFASLSVYVAWLKWIGIAILIIFAVIGWALGTFKIPESNLFEILKKTGGESVDVIAKRVWHFRQNRKIYVYKGGK